MATRLAPSREWSRIRESKSYQAEALEKSHHGSFQSVQTQEARISRLCWSEFVWTCAQVPSWRQGGSIPVHWEQNYKVLHPHRYDGPHFDWPPYRQVTEGRDQIEHVRFEYAALVSMCDHYLGQVLNLMD